MKFTDALKVYPQYILPQRALSTLMNKITRSKTPAVKNFLMNQVINHFNVDMRDSLIEDYREFPTFNHFFTRELKPDIRPICDEKGSIACPVDGAISQMGKIEGNQIFQAKGHSYSLEALIGCNESSKRFKDGDFATIYLSPKDYHRIHTPLSAKLTKMIHVPGKLFSVNTVTTENIPGLFARNERVVNLFETEAGPMAVILVGAILVSSIETVWAGTITPPYGEKVQHSDYKTGDIELSKGDELGRFNYGSTAIVLFGENKIEWDKVFSADTKTKVGQRLGTILS